MRAKEISMRIPMLLSTGATIALIATGCGSDQSAALPQGGETVQLDPAEFTTEIDNRYWPMTPGTTWVYRETDAEGNEQRVVVTVTDETREVMGIQTRVVHDLVTEGGEPIEDTYDWYAQDADGNLWYFGEETKEFENGKVVSTEGSWEAGVDGAQPGIVVPGSPEVGMTYRQEYLAGEAEDGAAVLSLDEQVEAPQGSYQGVLMTKDLTPLHPEILEYKFYAEGVGPVVVLGVSGGIGREELVEYTRP
ncbi:MAG: hypothetical protein OEW52_04710 [Thermoleophilia bacterium]|nr:hypothetical protein [Thermoleophilia bacterium]